MRVKSIRVNTLILSMAFLLISCYSGNRDGQTQRLPEYGSSVGFQVLVDSIIHSKMEEYDIPGIAIGLVQNDSIIYTKGYGFKKFGGADRVTEQSVFHTASVSKLFTAQAVMHLVERELIGLDDEISDILPELNYVDEITKEITVKQVLNHTSGLPDIINYHWSNNNQSESSLRDYFLSLELKVSSQPGEKFHYSNLGYDLLGLLVEKISGMPFEDFVKEEILDPGGIDRGDFRYFKIPNGLRVSPHSKNKITRRVYTREVYPYTREHAPSSTLNASATDLSNWMVYFMKKLNTEDQNNIYKLMIKPSYTDYARIGLGFQLYDIDGYEAVGHFGGDNGFRSLLMMIPDKKVGLVVLGNCDYNEDYRQEILLPIAKLMLENKYSHN